MGKKEKITVVIPAYNEEKNIRELITRSRNHCDDVLVVLSKKSKDRTRSIVKEMGTPFIIDNGRGKGDALRCAIRHVKEGIIVFIDADGSHNPDDIPRLTGHITEKGYDMVIGSRMTGGSDEFNGTIDEFFRLMFGSIITLLINLRFGSRISDHLNGFRALRSEVAKKIGLRENIATIEQEMGIKFLKKGYKVSEIPCHEYFGGRSTIHIWRDGPKFLWQLLRDIW